MKATETVPSAPEVNEVKDTDTQVTGSAKAGSKVTVKVGEQEIGTSQADENGNYSIDIPKQEAGTKLSVTASNSAGTSEAKEVTVKATLVSPTINDYYQTDAYAKGIALGASKVALYVDGKFIRTATVEADGTYKIYTGDIAKLQKEGAEFEIAARDAAGNESARTKGTVLAREQVAAPTIQ
ncbi:Ig-like domain-containing protein, partial [Bacillus mycoides]|uniref:Ig-like domain-containing protein n=1 Tax=Bacillus mycoides TaxID=1405 RepID=UPI003D64866E